jgi:serine/threonine protein kinase
MQGVSLGDRYLLQEQIGQGGVGTVWRGFDSMLERPVAIKLLDSEGLRPEGRERMLAEEVPLFPLVYSRVHFLLKPWISSFPTSPVRHWYFKDVVIDPH